MAFKDIAGQKQALSILQGTIRKKRTPSAFLFSGDLGIGKCLAAVNYAKTLNCLGPQGPDCCDKCSSCGKIATGNHPDVLVVSLENVEKTLSLKPKESKDGNRYEYPIEAIRKIEEFLYLKSYEGGYKVVIIDDADAMNLNTANAFLKTLEEPPPGSLIILVTSEAGALPDTIRSRCTNVVFRPLPLAECKKLTEGRAGDSPELAMNLAGGRPGFCVSRDFPREKERFLSSLQDIFSGSASKDAWKDKAEIRQWLELASVFIRDIVIAKLPGHGQHSLLGDLGGLRTPNNRPFAEAIKKVDIERLLETHRLLERFKGVLDFNPNKSISWNYVSSLMKGCLD
ncbi:MAG: DNA polymerase III subunit delta' [Nitrospirae bacterium]|nr:MAG: DNA polymerase III subunit delta' [Nitrospirota bacterium]